MNELSLGDLWRKRSGGPFRARQRQYINAGFLQGSISHFGAFFAGSPRTAAEAGCPRAPLPRPTISQDPVHLRARESADRAVAAHGPVPESLCRTRWRKGNPSATRNMVRYGPSGSTGFAVPRPRQRRRASVPHGASPTSLSAAPHSVAQGEFRASPSRTRAPRSSGSAPHGRHSMSDSG